MLAQFTVGLRAEREPYPTRACRVAAWSALDPGNRQNHLTDVTGATGLFGQL
jgi:hypothetical protein